MKHYPFQFIARQGQVAVVQVTRDGVTERCTLPMEIILASENELSEAQINAGVPYGLPFAEFLPEGAETALHNAGIWSLSDLYNKANLAVGALSPSEHLKINDVIRAAESYLKEDHKPVLKAAHPAHKTKIKKEKIP
jgi:hypothetical protein